MRSKIQYTTPALCLSEIGIVHSLGEEGVPVYSGSTSLQNPAMYSRFVKKRLKFSSFREETFIDEMVQLGPTFADKPVIYSDDDNGILLISKNRDRLAPYYKFLFPDHEMVHSILDKAKFTELCKDYDLPGPAWFSVLFCFLPARTGTPRRSRIIRRILGQSSAPACGPAVSRIRVISFSLNS